MIVRLYGKLEEKRRNELIVNVHGICYEVVVPAPVFHRIEETTDNNGNIHLIIYHYLQVGPSSSVPVLIGFINELERDFFLQFIKVSGIGPRAAVRALNKPISEITRAIEEGDLGFLTTLPGIGRQRAKEIIAKLQGKIGKFGLIKDKTDKVLYETDNSDWKEEALSVLVQLQYKKNEAKKMIEDAISRSKSIHTTEELLNEIYRHRMNV